MGADANSVFAGGATAIVVHAAADDMKTDPSGNAGAHRVRGGRGNSGLTHEDGASRRRARWRADDHVRA